jgi:hypothetical protein
VGLRTTDERIPFRMIERLDGQIDVQVRPVQVMWRGELDVRELPDRGVPEPREILERQKPFAFADEQPEAVSGDVADFDDRSVSPTRRGFPPRAPR